MTKSKIKINLGCGTTILSFFLGLIALVFVVGVIFLVLMELLLA